MEVSILKSFKTHELREIQPEPGGASRSSLEGRNVLVNLPTAWLWKINDFPVSSNPVV